MPVQSVATGSAAALNADAIAFADVSLYNWVGLSITGAFVGTLTFQISNDNVNWVSLGLFPAAGGALATTTTAAGFFQGPLPGKYFRVRMTAYTSGTASANAQLSTDAMFATTTTVTSNSTIVATPLVGTQGNAWNAAAVGVNGNSTSVDCVYLSVVSAFGSVSAATTIRLMLSQDNVNFYYSGKSYVAAGADDFAINAADVGARYVRLQSTAAATITGTIAGNG